MVEVHVAQLRFFGVLTSSSALVVCSLLQPSHVNCDWTQPWYSRKLLLAKCKYNALFVCFILCTYWSVQRINICYSKYLFELAHVTEDCIFGAEVPVFAP